jgi:uncharacterized protein (TIGR02118 family)
MLYSMLYSTLYSLLNRYLALGHLYFESVDAFVQAWAPQAQEIVGDVPNYTNSEPIIQISTVKI